MAKDNTFKNESRPINDTSITAEKIAVDEVPETKTVIGYVTDCFKLNIREKPSMDANVLYVAPLNEDLVVDISSIGSEEPDDEFTVPEWLHVYTKFGIEGYCMKKYVNIPE